MISTLIKVDVEIDWGYDEDDKVRVKMNDGEGDLVDRYAPTRVKEMAKD